jgi:hypothetical protein
MSNMDSDHPTPRYTRTRLEENYSETFNTKCITRIAFRLVAQLVTVVFDTNIKHLETGRLGNDKRRSVKTYILINPSNLLFRFDKQVVVDRSAYSVSSPLHPRLSFSPIQALYRLTVPSLPKTPSCVPSLASRSYPPQPPRPNQTDHSAATAIVPIVSTPW